MCLTHAGKTRTIIAEGIHKLLICAKYFQYPSSIELNRDALSGQALVDLQAKHTELRA